MIYAPFQQDRGGFVRFVSFVARTATPASVADGIRAEIRRAAPDLPIESTVIMDEGGRWRAALPDVAGGAVRDGRDADRDVRHLRIHGLRGNAAPPRDWRAHGARRLIRRDVLRLVLTRALRIVAAGLIVGLVGACRGDSRAADVPVRGGPLSRVHDCHAAADGGGRWRHAARAPRDEDCTRASRCSRAE